MSKAIISTLDPSIRHRAGITDCPHCDAKYDDWETTATALVTGIVQGKHGSVVVISECPKCFEKSWVHQEFSMFRDWNDAYPDEWKAAASREFGIRHLASVIRFADSLCCRCKHLRHLECDTLPIIKCTYARPTNTTAGKYLHSCFTETKCPKFVERKGKSK